MMRVATFAMNDRMLQASMKSQGKMAELQLQSASGVVSGNYGGLGASAKKVISLEVSLERSKSYVAAASEAASRVEVMYSTMSTVTDLLTKFRATVTTLKSTDSTEVTRETLATAAQSYLEELATLLNTQYEGRYLFAGSATTTRPVDISSYVATDATTASTSYYLGDSTLANVQVSGQQNVSYGVTADASAFEEAFRGFSLIAISGGNFDTDTLDAAYNLIVSALDGATALQSKLSINAATLERAQAGQEEFQSFVTTHISDIKNIDVAAVTVQLTSYETQLQASYAALAKIQALSIADYLR